MRMRKKKHTEERIAVCAELLVTEPEKNKGRWREVFSDITGNTGIDSLELEIGCGKGAFILGMAKRYPDRAFIAVESCREALLTALERVKAEKIQNVLFMNVDAAFIASFFNEGEVDAIYLNFSDPWPKSRHAKRRLTAPKFLESYKYVLSDGGFVRQKTDNTALFEFSLESFENNGFSVSDVTRDLHSSGFAADNIMTEYEKNFSEKGFLINALTARKKK